MQRSGVQIPSATTKTEISRPDSGLRFLNGKVESRFEIPDFGHKGDDLQKWSEDYPALDQTTESP